MSEIIGSVYRSSGTYSTKFIAYSDHINLRSYVFSRQRRSYPLEIYI